MKFGEIVRKGFPQIIIVFLSFALMVAVSYLLVSDIVGRQIFNYAQEMLRNAETAIRSDFREVEVALINTSLFMENRLQSGWSEGRLRDTPNWQGIKMVQVFKRLFNGWYLSIAAPAERYFSDVRSMAITLSILGAGFMTILSTFLIRWSVLKARSDEESREKTSRLNIEKRRYHIASVINDTINMIRPRAAEKSLDFLVTVDSAIPAELIGDEGRLRQVMTNLLTNAVKYTQSGFISLDVAIENRAGKTLKLVFSVQDSGVGIHSEDIGRLFTDFTRLDSQTNQGIEGTGLGLVITRAFCRAMGGDVTVSSEYGKGSVFRAGITQDFESEQPAAHIDNPLSNRVICFDWRPRHVRSLTAAFNSLGIAPVCAPDFGQFQQALEKGDYDYAFISSRYAMDCIYALGRRADPLELVIMVEPGEASVFREISSIQMPVYSVILAGVFDKKRISAGTPDSNTKLPICFTAPEAKILIVDDISTNLRVAKELMNPYNMSIHTCLSGAEAVDLIRQNRYDVVFMDHMMPGMDGIEAAVRIRAIDPDDGYFRKLPVIALTANAVTGQRELFLQSGINDFLAKPIDIRKLNDVLEKWLPAEKRIESLRAAEEAGPEKEAFPEGGIPGAGALAIAGLDTGLGLHNTGGSPAAYFDILSDFCRDAETRPAQISEALASEDTRLYLTLVHALKGAARSIGAVEAGEAAAWLEESAETGDPARIREKTAELLDKLRVLADNIKNAEKRREQAAGREPADLSVLNLEALKTALAGMDVEAVNKLLLEYAGLSLDSAAKSRIAEVEQYILMFEYDKAIEKINELL